MLCKCVYDERLFKGFPSKELLGKHFDTQHDGEKLTKSNQNTLWKSLREQPAATTEPKDSPSVQYLKNTSAIIKKEILEADTELMKLFEELLE